MPPPITWIAFIGTKCIESGAPRDVATAVKNYVDAHSSDNLLIFDAITSQPVEIDLRGSLSAVLKRLPTFKEPTVEPAPSPPAITGRGRPKLGVVAREVTLLPRHWEWLAAQPGGASVALRKLVEQARRASANADHLRQTRESVFRFMSAMAGNEPGYEEATRALFAGDHNRLHECIAKWPRDIRNHTLVLAELTLNDSEQITETP